MSHYKFKSKVQIHEYENGMKLVYQLSPTKIPLSSIHIFFNVGSAFEVDNYRGMAHMVEHMVFKGTKKKLPQEISKLLDKTGAEYNAYTSKRLTCYLLKSDSIHLDKTIPVIGDMLYCSTFPSKEYKKEREVVYEENEKNENSEGNVNYENFCKIAYDGTSYIHPVDTLEFHDSKTDWTLEDVKLWYKHYYQPKNTVFSIVTNLSFSKIKDILANTDFTKENKFISGAKGLLFPQTNLSLTAKQNIVCEKKIGMSNVHMMIGFPTYGYHDERRFRLILLSRLLNGMSGRLFNVFREDTPLTYTTYAETEYEEFGGYFAIVIQCGNDKLFSYKSNKKGVIPNVVNILSSLKKEGITKKELELAKDQVRNSLLMNFETIDQYCEYNGRYHLLYNKPFIPLETMYDKYYKDITISDINESLRELFVREKMAFTLLSHNPPSVDTIRKNFIF